MSQEEVLAPYAHIAQCPGKGFRGRLIQQFNTWIGCTPEMAQKIGRIVQTLHNASLLVDDIEDGSVLRRGQPAAHRVFGTPLTLNAANYMYFMAMQWATELCDDAVTTGKVLTVFTHEMCVLHRGQGQDIVFRDTNTVPTVEQYEQMARDKTGGLFRLTVRLMQLLAPADSPTAEFDFAPLLNKMGIFFQVLDDFLNLDSSDYHANKDFCEDITEGKWSYPILHSVGVAAGRQDTRLRSIVRQHTTDPDLKRFCLKLIAETGSFDHTRVRLSELLSELTEMISSISGGNPGLVELLCALHEQVHGRKLSDSPKAGPMEAMCVQPPVAKP